MNNLVIRKARQDDLSAVQTIARQCWHDTYEGIIPIDIQDKFIDLAYSDDMMAKRLNGSLLLVAEIGTAIIGFANFSFLNDAKETELNAIYLLNHAQGCGVGSALLKRAISELSGVKTILLDVEKANQPSVDFYKNKGFEILKEYKEDFEGHQLETIRMHYQIPHVSQ